VEHLFCSVCGLVLFQIIWWQGLVCGGGVLRWGGDGIVLGVAPVVVGQVAQCMGDIPFPFLSCELECVCDHYVALAGHGLLPVSVCFER
jgi:hypothetical protein